MIENLSVVIDKVINEDEKNELIERINMISKLEDMTSEEVIERAVTTFLAQRIKPLLANYETIYLEKGIKIGARSASLEEIGKKPRKTGTHGMPNHLEVLFNAFGESPITQNITLFAARLVGTTLDDIISYDNPSDDDSSNMSESNKKSKARKARKYLKAIEKSNFIYMMLQVAVKVIGEDLYKKKLECENETLKYMTAMINKDRNEISQIFKEALANNEDLNNAVTEYYNKLAYYYEDFKNRNHNISGESLDKMSSEIQTVKQFKEENILIFIGYLVREIKNESLIKYRLYELEDMITIE